MQKNTTPFIAKRGIEKTPSSKTLISSGSLMLFVVPRIRAGNITDISRARTKDTVGTNTIHDNRLVLGDCIV